MPIISRKGRHLLSDLSIPNRRFRLLYSPTRHGRRFRVHRYRQSTHLRPFRQKGQTRDWRPQLQHCRSPLQRFPPSQTLASYPISNSVGNGQTTLKRIHHLSDPDCQCNRQSPCLGQRLRLLHLRRAILAIDQRRQYRISEMFLYLVHSQCRPRQRLCRSTKRVHPLLHLVNLDLHRQPKTRKVFLRYLG